MKKSLISILIVPLFLALLVYPGKAIGRGGGGGGGGSRGGGGGGGGNGGSFVPPRYSGSGSGRSYGRSGQFLRSYGGGYYRNNGNWSGRNGHYNRNSGNHYNRGTYGRNGSDHYASYRDPGRSPSTQARRMGISNVSHIGNHSQMLPASNRHSPSGPPSRGPNGRAMSSRMVSTRQMSSSTVRDQMSRISRDSDFSRQVNTYNATETRAGEYNWHNWNGQDFCHYCDRWGCNWYGWGCGAGFFWAQFYWDNWWWCDPVWDNWCYWNDGNWWWQDPQTDADYVYDNGNYIPADSNNPNYGNNGYGDAPNHQPPNDAGNANPTVYTSPDGDSVVQIQGSTEDAFLYKYHHGTRKSGSKPVYLASNVAVVKYSKENGQILLIKEDGSFQVFKADGSAPSWEKPAGKTPPRDKPAV